jgi:hypothetical protein
VRQFIVSDVSNGEGSNGRCPPARQAETRGPAVHHSPAARASVHCD